MNRNNAGDKQALGCSRGGVTSQIVGVCYAAGPLIDLVLVAGHAHELSPSLQQLIHLPGAPAWAIADTDCGTEELRPAPEAMGATWVVPSRKNAKQKKPYPGLI